MALLIAMIQTKMEAMAMPIWYVKISKNARKIEERLEKVMQTSNLFIIVGFWTVSTHNEDRSCYRLSDRIPNRMFWVSTS